MSRYLMKEVVYFGNPNVFSTPPRIAGKTILIEGAQDRITITYGIESDLDPKTIVESRLQVSQLVHGIFGDGFMNYDSQLFSVRDNNLSLVGFVRSRVPHLNGIHLVSTPGYCTFLLYAILQAQLEYKSALVDGLVAAMSQANMGGFVESSFAWTWWGFEWLIQALNKMKPPRVKFDYVGTNSQGDNRNIRKLFKSEVKRMVSAFRNQVLAEYRFTGDQSHGFESDMNGVLEQVNSSLLRPTFIEMFDGQLPFLKEVVDAFLKFIESMRSTIHADCPFQDWSVIRNQLIAQALEARNQGFHFGIRAGILEGKGFDVYDGMRRFAGWVCFLLTILLSVHPYEYDSKCAKDTRRLLLAPRPPVEPPVQQLSISSLGVMEWYEYEQDQIVTRSTQVSNVVLKDDYVIYFSCQQFKKPSRDFCLVDQRKPLSADFTITTDDAVASGDLLGLDTLRIHRFFVRATKS